MSIIVGLSSICGILVSCRPLLEGSSTSRCRTVLAYLGNAGTVQLTQGSKVFINTSTHDGLVQSGPSSMSSYCPPHGSILLDHHLHSSFNQFTSHDFCVSHAQPIAEHTADAVEYL